MQSQFRKLDTVKGEFSIRGINLKDAHHTVAAYGWLDGVVGPAHFRAKKLLRGLWLWRFDRGSCRQPCKGRDDNQRQKEPTCDRLRPSAKQTRAHWAHPILLRHLFPRETQPFSMSNIASGTSAGKATRTDDARSECPIKEGKLRRKPLSPAQAASTA